MADKKEEKEDMRIRNVDMHCIDYAPLYRRHSRKDRGHLNNGVLEVLILRREITPTEKKVKVVLIKYRNK